jgi:hypothetical protein
MVSYTLHLHHHHHVCAYITECASTVSCAVTEVSMRVARPRTLASAAAENSVDSTNPVYSSSASTSGSSAAGTTVGSGVTSSGSNVLVVKLITSVSSSVGCSANRCIQQWRWLLVLNAT